MTINESEVKKALFDCRAGKITREQLKEMLINLGFEDEFAEWEIEDFEMDDLRMKVKAFEVNPEAAFDAAITCLEKYGNTRSFQIS